MRTGARVAGRPVRFFLQQTSMHFPCKPRKDGFTLVELVFVIVIVGIMSAYVTMQGYSAAEMSLPSQAQKMASDIRHARTLATTWGQRLRLSVTAGANGNYQVVSCTVNPTTGVVSSCNASPVVDPVTGIGFSVNLQKGVALAGPTTLDFNSLGQPSAAASYTLTSGSVKTINVAALTGFVTVAP